MRKSTAINLELTKGEDVGVKFYAKQFDDLKIKAKIYNGLNEVNVLGQKITVCIVKEDNTVIEQTDDIIIEENSIVINLSKQATTALGKCTMEISLTDEEGTASTSTISYLVGEKLSASIVEMIKSANDINALNIIEEFIKTSNIDILDIKGAIIELRNAVNNAQNSINAEYESIILALRALEGTIIGNINAKGNEAITNANSAVVKANEAVAKTDRVLVQIEEAKLDALGAVSQRGTNVGQDLTAMATTLKSDITATGTLETNKVIEANTEALSAIELAKTNAISNLGTEATKVEGALNVTVTEIKKQAETDLNACKIDLDAYILLAKEQGKTDLDGIKNGVILEVNNLKASVDNVLASITQKVTESNSNIVELTALIEEAKTVAGLVREFIATNSSSVDLSNYYTKAEVDTLLSKKVGFIDRFGTGLYMEAEPIEFQSAPTPTFEPLHTIKMKTNAGYQIIYFNIPLTGGDKFITTNTGTTSGNLAFNNIAYTEYAGYRYSSGSWVANQSILVTSFSAKTTKIYYHNFPIFDNTGVNILFNDTTLSGISNFNNAIIEGKYSIDLSEADFNNLYNGVKVEGGKRVVGVLDVRKVGTNVIQILDLASHGLAYMRTVGGNWINTSSGAVSKSAVGKVKVSAEGLPEFLKNIPPLPLYGQETKDILIFRATSTLYYVYRFLDGWGSGKSYYAGSTSFYINVSKAKAYLMTYNSLTDTWSTEDTNTTTSAIGSITVTKADFKIYHNTMQIYTTSAGTVVYQDVTIPNSGESTLLDANEATTTGIYEIDVKTGDKILNLPITTKEAIDAETQETSIVLAENLKGLLQVHELGKDIYQEITSNDNINCWRRTRVDSVWSSWRKVITEAMFLRALNLE